MAASLQNSVVLISSSENSVIGTGFVIYREGEAAYIVTTAQLIGDVGGPEKVQVDRLRASLLAIGRPEELDLAVVYVAEGLKKPSVASLSSGRVAAASIQVIGFHREGGVSRIGEVHGRLGPQIFFHQGDKMVAGWDLLIEGPWQLESDSNGSPLADLNTGVVLGMVVKESTGERRSTAVSLEALRLIWPDIPRTLLPATRDSSSLDEPTSLSSESEYDVFLSYNRVDKDIVHSLAETLKQRDLNVALDVWSFCPGRPWPESFEKIITNCKTAAVCVAHEGIGPWENREINALLTRLVELQETARIFSVIPVLLPGAPSQDVLPVFLKDLTCVDLRRGIEKDEIDRLVAAIKGPDKLEWDEHPKINLDGLESLRSGKLRKIESWIGEGCRIVSISGMQGLGKTCLARQLADRLKSRFHVICRSLTAHPTLSTIVADTAHVLGQPESNSDAIDAQSRELVRILKEHRCLFILDEYDSILRPDGTYFQGFGEYRNALIQLAEEDHQSCVLLTTRIVPAEVNHLANAGHPVRRLRLRNLSMDDGRKLMKSRGRFSGSDDDWRRLIGAYGSPVYLRIVGMRIARRYRGDLHRFLEKHRAPLPIERLLDHQWEQLSQFQRSIVLWLAVRRVPAAQADLQKDLLGLVTRHELVDAMQFLEDLFPIKRTAHHLITLERFAMQYVTRKLIEEVCGELIRGKPALLHTHALLKATSPDRIQEMQRRHILRPVIDRLSDATADVASCIKRCLPGIPSVNTVDAKGYTAGNLVNLLLELGCSLNGCDFSHTYVREADFRRCGQLQGVDFRNCRFSHSLFLEVLRSVLSVAFHPTKQCFAAGDSHGNVYVWNWPEGTLRCLFEENKTLVWGLSFGPDGTLATGCVDGTVKLFDVESGGTFLGNLGGHLPPGQTPSGVNAIAWSPTGNHLASGGRDGIIRLWDTARRTLVAEWHAHERMLHSLAFGPSEDVLASAGGDGTAKLWKVAGRRELGRLPHDGAVYTVAFDKRGQLLVTGGEDHKARIWDISGSDVRVLHTLGGNRGHQAAVSTAVFFDNGRRIATASHDRTIKLWHPGDSGRWRCGRTLRGHASGVNRIAVNSDEGTLLCSGGEDQAVRIWNLETGSCLRRMVGFDNAVNSVRFLDPDRLASGSDDHMIRIWEWKRKTCEHTIFSKVGRVNYLAVSHDGQILASGRGDGRVALWHRSTGLEEFVGRHDDNGAVVGLAFHPKNTGYLASIGGDGAVRIWGRAGRAAARIEASKLRGAVAFSPDGATMAFTYHDGSVILRDVAGSIERLRLPGHPNFLIHALAFSPDGKLLATAADDRLIKLWNIGTGRCSQEALRGHEDYVTDLAFHPHGELLASSSGDRTVRVWQVRSGDCVAVLAEHWRAVHSVTFSPADDSLASGGADGAIKIWEVHEKKFVLRASVPLPRPYEDMKIAGASFGVEGANDSQIATLRKLGADDVN